MQKKRLTKKGQDPRSNKVSIYTSTYNSDLELLEEVFYKIKNQTHRDWENRPAAEKWPQGYGSL